MSIEAPRPQAEQQQDPVQEARAEFNRELLGREYRTGVLLGSTLQLQNALLQSSLSSERIYHELGIVAGQGADRAEIYDDTDTASTLRQMQRGFQLTYEAFKPKIEPTLTYEKEKELLARVNKMEFETLAQYIADILTS